jgi:hypothetical protein
MPRSAGAYDHDERNRFAVFFLRTAVASGVVAYGLTDLLRRSGAGFRGTRDQVIPNSQSSIPEEPTHMTPLRRRMSDDMQLRNLASETQRNYIHHITLRDWHGFIKPAPTTSTWKMSASISCIC